MKILNIGSLNLDHVYNVDHIVAGGETQSSKSLRAYCGGKGLNQSIALARAGALVFHGGLIGSDGEALLDMCRENGIDTTYIRQIDGRSGHTVIQVDKQGQNSILLYGGANHQFTEAYIDDILKNFGEGDILLLQNEINFVDYIVEQAFLRGIKIILNPSPMNEALKKADLTKVSLFIMNEIEGEQITGEKEAGKILARAKMLFPKARLVLTLGKKGSVYTYGNEELWQKAYPANAVDTTAAGDTFTGYFIAGMTRGLDAKASLDLAAKASALAVGRRGAAPSIPWLREV